MPVAAMLGVGSTDVASGPKEKYPPNDDADNPIYRTNEFRMYCLKVLPCSKRYCHDWTTCPFAHAAEKAKRRDPRVYNYTGVACPEMKKNQTCPRGDQCPYAHNVFEYWLHHSRYRTQLCNDGAGCKRKICFFAHTLDELRVSSVKVQVPEGCRSDSSSGCINPFAPSPRASRHGSNAHNSNNAAVAADKNGPLVSASSSPSNYLGLGEYNGMSEAPAEPSHSALLQDQLALEQLMRLMALAQQQPAAQQPDMQQLMAAQLLMAQQQLQQQAAAAAAAQQQQAAAVLQAQQQMAALQLLGQMGQLLPGMQEQYAAAMAAAGQFGGGFPPQMQSALQQQQAAAAMAAALAGMGNGMNSNVRANMGNGAHGRPPTMVSALTAALGASSQDPPSSQPMDELTRQLSGLSASSQVPMSPMDRRLSGLVDDPSSARSYGSAYTPNTNGPSRPSLQSQRSSHGLPSEMMGGGMSQPSKLGGFGAGASGPVARGVHASSAAHGAGGLHTSPISISALADGYTTTTGNSNSYFSISHSLTSSHDGSDLEALPQ